MLDALDRRIIARVCGDIGEGALPYHSIAAELGITVDTLLARLHAYRDSGQLRRFGAILRHQQAGYAANGMSCWAVPADEVERVGRAMASCPEITHCYERPPMPDWPYNVYAMIHGHTEDDCRAVAERLARELGLTDYDILFSLHEYKKTSMVYLAR